MSAKKDMLSRLSGVAKSAPLQESSSEKEHMKMEQPEQIGKKAKPARKAKNLQIPEDLWEAYETIKSNNTTSLLMTGYILEAFREKLARDGAFYAHKNDSK
ncbi:molecular chaperone [Dickeya oryzae]|uniref:molecular chaperone n=1 Tax=Dickeya oryzae TaxID=1240404 RepID=UPI001AECF18B|nr:molecular chaperone [Dickeya oryzae]MBP2845803.1 molecular chaperone [Dickeya oryzae]